ncbi:YbaB/EbfC family nucleoid-associated protein [Nocardia otitidiscaviarum]|uniref:YbaB/EbfC family nucleoid-associated protein n=1 Tax=Nocardia otitidiscaviarum TaxID=1823 RepID=UPI001E5F8FA9|nr:YbaB/EbfC family nucleoid-associated protein [Nocardia otitidiscaviarum]
MVNDNARAEMHSLLDEVQRQFADIARLQRERARLTASASARKGRVTVTVNADGAIVKTKFSADIDDLDYGEIADAVTEAAQQAFTEVSRRGQELMGPLRDRRARLPKLSDLIEGLPDVSEQIPVAPPVSMADPDVRQRRVEADPLSADESRGNDRPSTPGATETSW